MIKNYFLILLTVLSTLPGLLAQGIVFDQEHVDIGEVRNWGLQPAVFHFTNHSASRVFIMKSSPDPDLRVIYPRSYIQPGQSDSIRVYYIPRRREAFKADVEIWSSDRSKPYKLSLEGNAISLDECPGTPGAVTPDPPRLIRVVEKGSGNPVPGAEVTLERTRNDRFRDHTDRKGQYTRDLRPGLYSVNVNHRDYLPHHEEFYLDRSTLILVFEIEPEIPELTVDEIPQEQPQPIPVPETQLDTFVELTVNDEILPYPGPDSLDDNLLPWKDYRQNNIVFLIDVSSSMRSKDKLPLLKGSMKQLVKVIRSVDNVSLIIYANEPRVLVEGAAGNEKELLNNAVDSLNAKGRTYGVEGLQKAYEIAERNFIPGANNLVIVATDGEFNSPDFSSYDLLNLVRTYERKDIHTSVIGFGQATIPMLRMNQIALAGKGSYMHIDSGSDGVEEILVEEIKKQSKR